MRVNVAIVDAFVDSINGGNPAGVVLNADRYSPDQKLTIAKQVGLSETAFVSRSSSADFKLDFFTPQRQIAHCGHATIGTFSYLSQRGLIQNKKTSKETIDGKRDIEVLGDFAYMSQTAPSYATPDETNQELAQILGLKGHHVVTQPQLVSTGNRFLIIEVDHIATLESIQPDYNQIEALSERYDLIGVYVFCQQTYQPNRDATTRMFAPRYGIKEESATGMAAGPLACYLHDCVNKKKTTYQIEQGYAMTPQSPSCIEVVLSLKETSITGLKAGGIGRLSQSLQIEI